MVTFRIFCAAKNEPNPTGGSTPQGSLSISVQRKAQGNTMCRSHFYFKNCDLFLSCDNCFLCNISFCYSKIKKAEK